MDDWSDSSYSSENSASSESTASSTDDVSNNQATGGSVADPKNDEASDFPFDFASVDAASDDDDDHDNADESDDADDGFESAAGSLTSTQTPNIQQLPTSYSLPTFQEEGTTMSKDVTSQNDLISGANNDNILTQEQSSNLISESTGAASVSVLHRGSLRRIINPSEVHNNNYAHSPSRHHYYDQQKAESSQSSSSTTSWPMYSITVALQNQNLSPMANQQHYVDQYQIIFSRQQYEFCTRIFALLDTDSQSHIGPECIRNFLYLHCPVIRRRDGAIAMLNKGQEMYKNNDIILSPTVDEIWNIVTSCDPKYRRNAADEITRIGIEGWMILCRLLALVYEQESQRRFSSRHLQQMMRHKHGSGGMGRSGIINPNEVVVVVDNPPPGPPAPISIEALMQVERERGRISTNECIQGWQFCPLSMPELDLDHCLLPTVKDTVLSTMYQSKGRISIEPFSSSTDGGFILCFERNGDRSKQSIVARRSYADFEWLNQILISHKRPGHGHLCGRILPPFPTKRAVFVVSSTAANQDLQKEVGDMAISAAKSSVGILTSVAKSLWGSVAGTTTTSPEHHTQSGTTGVVESIVPSIWAESPKDGDVPIDVAHAIERYLNYLCENEAFTTSFPLNAILQGSQTGLESAKQVLHEHFKLKKKEKKVNQPATSSEGKLASASAIYNALVRKRSSSSNFFQDDDDTPWLRAAAHVAMALQFHGILETTGYESTSARIQHASLPKFNNAKSSWDEEDHADSSNVAGSLPKSSGGEACFETGVVRIESELNNEDDMGYDLLPLPGPSEEQSVLNAGTSVLNTGGTRSTDGTRQFIYRMATDREHVGDESTMIGAMNVETDIERVQGVIKAANHTLGKVYSACMKIQGAQYERNSFQKCLLSDIDSWCGDSGEVISQRALVSGIESVSTANGNSESSCKNLSNDLSWQSSLATSAVTAAAEVRGALKASHTASRAKNAAFAAAERAKESYESCDSSSSKEEIQATQKNAFVTQSHAIHATVVEYEASLSLKRASVSLAHDVKCWNVHRKKELLQTCIEFAKSQKEACEKASEALIGLRDGLINSEYTPLTTVGFDVLVNEGICAPSLNTPSIARPEQYERNLAESDDSHIGGGQNSTAREVNGSSMSNESSQSSLVASEEIERGDIYDVTSSELLNVDYDYFAYRQENSNSHEFSSEVSDGIGEAGNEDIQSSNTNEHDTFENEMNDREAQIICNEESNDEVVADDEKSSSSASMQSLIDGLMTWGDEDVRPGIAEDNAYLFE